MGKDISQIVLLDIQNCITVMQQMVEGNWKYQQRTKKRLERLEKIFLETATKQRAMTVTGRPVKPPPIPQDKDNNSLLLKTSRGAENDEDMKSLTRTETDGNKITVMSPPEEDVTRNAKGSKKRRMRNGVCTPTSY